MRFRFLASRRVRLAKLESAGECLVRQPPLAADGARRVEYTPESLVHGRVGRKSLSDFRFQKGKITSFLPSEAAPRTCPVRRPSLRAKMSETPVPLEITVGEGGGSERR